MRSKLMKTQMLEFIAFDADGQKRSLVGMILNLVICAALNELEYDATHMLWHPM